MNAKIGELTVLDWPEPYCCSVFVPILKLSFLPKDVKSLIWADLQVNNPSKAECLKVLANDETVKVLMTEFGASLTLSKDDLSFSVYEQVKSYFG